MKQFRTGEKVNLLWELSRYLGPQIRNVLFEKLIQITLSKGVAEVHGKIVSIQLGYATVHY